MRDCSRDSVMSLFMFTAVEADRGKTLPTHLLKVRDRKTGYKCHLPLALYGNISLHLFTLCSLWVINVRRGTASKPPQFLRIPLLVVASVSHLVQYSVNIEGKTVVCYEI
jgi:hypothetical protein